MKAQRTHLSIAAVCLLAVCLSVSAEDVKTPAAGIADKSVFRDLWKRVEQADTTVDFTQLRLAYTKTSGYRPYDSRIQDLRSRMDVAFNQDDYATAVDLANKLLKKDPLQTEAHVVLDVSLERLGDSLRSRYDHYVAIGLIQSLFARGDGLTKETAFLVISTDEEYIVLNILGVELQQQALVDEEEHAYDVMTVHDPSTDSTYDLYFNIDLPMQALQEQ